MRLADFSDWLALRKHLVRPWAFLRLRKHPSPEPFVDVELKDGGTVRLRSHAQDRHVFHRVFARDEYRLDGVAPGSWDTVVDIGGHIGTFAIRASKAAKRVLAYEPTPESYELLVRNTGRRPNVQAHRLAVAGTKGTLKLILGKNPSRNSLYPPGTEPNLGEIEVAATTLEEIFRENAVERCDLLKVDCEGAEYDLLYAAPKELWPRIHRTCMEYHPVGQARPGWTGVELAKHLEAAGHRVELRPSRRHEGEGLLFSSR
jgi:FkbM family methyltransferase